MQVPAAGGRYGASWILAPTFLVGFRDALLGNRRGCWDWVVFLPFQVSGGTECLEFWIMV